MKDHNTPIPDDKLVHAISLVQVDGGWICAVYSIVDDTVVDITTSAPEKRIYALAEFNAQVKNLILR